MDSLDQKLRAVVAQYESLQAELAVPGVASDPDALRRLGKEMARLEPVVRTFRGLEATRAELAGSEYAWMASERAGKGWDEGPAIGGKVPQIDAAAVWKIYEATEKAVQAGRLVRSLHAPALGGLAAGLARVSLAGELGLAIDLEAIPTGEGMNEAECLFSESAGRFIATIDPEKVREFETLVQRHTLCRVRRHTENPYC